MVEVLTSAEKEKHSKHGGRTPQLGMEDRLLMALTYWRENRTYFHVAHAYGVSDNCCWSTIRWIENALIQSGVFRLPGQGRAQHESAQRDAPLRRATGDAVRLLIPSSGFGFSLSFFLILLSCRHPAERPA
jgi:hypothetical protein